MQGRQGENLFRSAAGPTAFKEAVGHAGGDGDVADRRDTPKRLSAATLPSEATLETYLERDPSLLGERLLVIGRKVP